MKVAVIGATGNVGTAVVRALGQEPKVTEVLGVARRLPDAGRAPYDQARWESVDLAVPTRDDRDEDRVVDHLAEVLRGCDAVVHLTWLIQPNHQRELLRRVNVEGTRRVAEACVRAGVGHLVVSSSVGAYSGVDDDDPRPESWPVGGAAESSHYAVDKAAQERALDEMQARHPDLLLTRVRPALVFDADAGAEITRYFLGALVPAAALRPGTLPLLPVPAGIRVQVVHADDLADAFCRILVQRAEGAFNVATEPVLRAQELADVVDSGRYLEVPAALIRPAVAVAWKARAVAADPGWLDMGMQVPLMDCSRARDELGWQPRHEAAETLRELLTGIADGQGTASPPMRPREQWPVDQSPPGGADPSGVTGPGEESSAHRLPAHLERDVLALYLSDHLTGATAGLGRARRMARDFADTDLGPDLATVAEDIVSERQFLAELIDSLHLRRRPHRQAVAAVAEKAGRLKLNERLTSSPMTPVLEVELMRSAVVGKLGGWETLAALAPDLGLPVELFTSLADRAREHADIFGRLHHHVAGDAFRISAE